MVDPYTIAHIVTDSLRALEEDHPGLNTQKVLDQGTLDIHVMSRELRKKHKAGQNQLFGAERSVGIKLYNEDGIGILGYTWRALPSKV